MTITKDKDWKQVIQKFQDEIPSITSLDYNSSPCIIRSFFVDIDDVFNNIPFPYPDIRIYADVVRFSGKRHPPLENNSLFIFARQVEVEAHQFKEKIHIWLVSENTKNANFELYTSKILGKLRVGTQLSTITVDVSDSIDIGTKVYLKNDTPIKEKISKVDENELDLGQDMRMFLGATFQIASISLNSFPNIAFPLLTWIQKVTASTIKGSDLYNQSSALLIYLANNNSGVIFVPFLSRKIYIESFESFLKISKKYETEYYRFIDKTETINDRRNSGKLMIQYYEDVSSANKKLISQAENDYKAAQIACDNAEVLLVIQMNKLRIVNENFRMELIKWEIVKSLEATKELCFAVLEFADAVAQLSIGNITKAPQTGDAIVKAADAVSKIEKIGNKMKKLVEVMNNLQKMVDNLSKTYSAVEKLITTTKGPSLENDLGLLEVNNRILTKTSHEDWNIFVLESKSLFQPIESEVSYAKTVMSEIEKFAAYGSAYNASKDGFISAGRALIELNLNQKISQNQVKNWQNYIDNLSRENKDYQLAAQMCFNRLLDLKRCLLLPLLNYVHAYEYWALSSSDVSPSMNKNISQFSEDLTKINEEFKGALTSFSPPPQTVKFKINFDPNKSESPEEAHNANLLLSQMKEKNFAVFNIDLKNELFKNYDRIRVKTIRCYLKGVRASNINDKITIQISTSGVYYDKRKNNIYKFLSDQLLREFSYEANNNKNIITDGKIDEDFKDYYFQPTVFTQWKIKVPEEKNKGVDLFNVNSIKLRFFCSAIPLQL
ncbi:hypothetical protein F8M41_011285 [Gigaspora margarita]|uniref:Uncharacterized protein n=1 Tax=Gigaspora margarita TaxID=4874 RepID=A0A8H4EPV2_GIGMA|nr:hypothetical protein F8M41_011285 [Gigaspora margarita]